MQNANSMKLTTAQMRNIENLPKEVQLEILHVCAEKLGLISPSEYASAHQMPKRTVYDQIKGGKIKTFEISGKLYPLINMF